MARQLQFALPKPRGQWGGKRRGAGRPPNGETAGVWHIPRPAHEEDHPVHVTYRVLDVPNLRRGKVTRALMRSVRAAHKPTFRIVHYTVQSNHVHLIVEASSKRALSRGMQGFASRAAREVNRVLGREGKLWADRYFAKVLATPTQVRNAIAYVLENHTKHTGEGGIDFWSSGPWFTGWAKPPVRPPSEPNPAARPQTFLLQKGWRRAGPPI